MHAIASLLPVPTCTCGLTFSTSALLQAHISLSTGSTTDPPASSGGTTPAATAPALDPRDLAAICQTAKCGHPRIAHGDRGPRCRIMLGAAGTSPCPCVAFS